MPTVANKATHPFHPLQKDCFGLGRVYVLSACDDHQMPFRKVIISRLQLVQNLLRELLSAVIHVDLQPVGSTQVSDLMSAKNFDVLPGH